MQQKILIIEDSMSVVEYLTQIMLQEGYIVHHAPDADEARILYQKIEFNLIILDLILPNTTGDVILKEIRQEKDSDLLPVIVLSTIEDEPKVAELLNIGANDFIHKPFSDLILKIKVKNLLLSQNKTLELIRQTEDLNSRKEKFKFLNKMFSEMLSIDKLEDVYQHFTDNLSKRFPNTIVLYNSINEEETKTRFEAYSGLNNKIINKIAKINITNPVGRQFELLEQHKKFFKAGKFLEFEGGLSEFSSSEFPAWASKAIEKLLDIHKIYTIGIKKDEKLFAAIHFFTLKNTEITESDFIEIFTQQSGVLLQKKLVEKTIIDNEEKMRVLNATKDKFFNIISHDLLNLFNSIQGFSELALKKLHSNEYAKVEQYCNQIHKTTDHTTILLGNLMQWARIQTGRMKFNPIQLNLREITSDIITLLEDIANEKSVSLKNTIGIQQCVIADKLMLETVLRNLIINAIKYSKPGGSVDISSIQHNTIIEIRVKDQGVGIKKENLGKMFRIDSANSTPGTRDEQGTGFGLILCKEFVHKHGGEIWIESEEDKGTMVKFTITRSN